MHTDVIRDQLQLMFDVRLCVRIFHSPSTPPSHGTTRMIHGGSMLPRGHPLAASTAGRRSCQGTRSARGACALALDCVVDPWYTRGEDGSANFFACGTGNGVTFFVPPSPLFWFNPLSLQPRAEIRPSNLMAHLSGAVPSPLGERRNGVAARRQTRPRQGMHAHTAAPAAGTQGAPALAGRCVPAAATLRMRCCSMGGQDWQGRQPRPAPPDL